LVEGIGYDFIPGVLDRSLVDEWVKTDDGESLKMSRRLVREEGLLCGGSSGAAMHAALLAARKLAKGQRCVVILPDGSRNYMSKFIDDDWMVEQGLEPASLLTKSSALLSLIGDSQGTRSDHLWWADKTVVDLNLPSPITVPPTMACADAAEVMRAHGIDQLPVVDGVHGVVGVVTLGHLSSKILSRGACARDPCSSLMFTRFVEAPLNTKLSAFQRIFERDAFCLIVTPMRHLSALSISPAVCPVIKKVVVAVCTQVDLLKYVVDGGAAAASASSHVAKLACVYTGSIGSHTAPAEARQAEAGPTNEMACAQLAWQFMKPPPKATHTADHMPSPVLATEAGVAGMPKIDMALANAPGISGQPTRFASPAAMPTEAVKAMPKMELK